jgi:hypothetical protein
MSGVGQSRRLTVVRLLPVFPYEQTSAASVGMSQKCHKETHAAQQTVLFIRSPRRLGRALTAAR